MTRSEALEVMARGIYGAVIKHVDWRSAGDEP